MKSFNKKKKKPVGLAPLLIRILVAFNNKLISFGYYLQQKMASYSIRKQKILLLLFCLLFTSESVFILYNGFKKKNFRCYAAVPIQTIPLVKRKEPAYTSISLQELRPIHRFKLYLDSLSRTHKGKRIKDSLLVVRPYLMDTLYYLENRYNEQLKNKPYGK